MQSVGPQHFHFKDFNKVKSVHNIEPLLPQFISSLENSGESTL